jgi:hypothetical protein
LGFLRWIFLAAMVLLGALLAWQVTTRALASRYAGSEPVLALGLSPDDPDALSNLSGQSLVGKGRVRSLGAAEAAARRAFAIAPLQSEALRNLGLIADARGRQAHAVQIMARASRRGFRDVPTQAWLLQRAILSGDFGPAFLRVDALLRTQPDLGTRLFPLIGALLSDPDAIEPLTRRLAADPLWRPYALFYLSEKAEDVRPVISIYQRLARLGRDPTAEETQSILTRMVKDGQYQEAYRLWASLLPDHGRVIPEEPYDGGFKGLPGSPPFNWEFVNQSGVTVQTARSDAPGGAALYLEYPVANASLLARQMLVLPPGPYRLSGRMRVTRPATGAALVWSIACAAPPGAVIAHVRQSVDSATDWTPFAVTFMAPADCGDQWLSLEGLAGDGFGILSAWVKGISIQRLSAGAVAAATPPPGATSGQDQRGQTTP